MIRLSACLICRNEAHNLPRVLDSVRDVADEIVVVDTGSTDDSVAIAEARGARIIRHGWNDDHSAARNVGWAHARGEWMLWLDADEALVAASIPELRRRIQSRDIGGYFIQRQELVDANDESRFGEMLMIRLIRRDLPVRFVGRYHTQIEPPSMSVDPPPWVLANSTIKLKHWGKLVTSKEERLKRAVRVMSKELIDEPDNLYVMIELANAYLDQDDPRGLELLREATRRLRPGDPQAPTNVVLYVIDHLLARPDEAQPLGYSLASLRELASRWFPRNAPMRWSVAQALFVANDFEAAAVELREVLRLITTDQHDKIAPFDPRTAEDATFNLAVCLTRLAQLDEAEAMFRAMAHNPRRANDAAANLAVIARLRTLM